MTVDEKYDRRIELCRTLRVIETEIENIDDIGIEWNSPEGNKKATLSIYVGGENAKIELGHSIMNNCLEVIRRDYLEQKEDIVKILNQYLK